MPRKAKIDAPLGLRDQHDERRSATELAIRQIESEEDDIEMVERALLETSEARNMTGTANPEKASSKNMQQTGGEGVAEPLPAHTKG